MGTGDNPSTENGAAGFAITMPQAFRLLNPRSRIAIASADSTTPTTSMLMPLWRGTGFMRKLRKRTTSEMMKISPNETRQLRAVAM